jgi:hypothetical protein
MGNRDARCTLVGFRERALRWAGSTAHARGRARRARRARVGARGADLGAGSGQVEGACAAHVGVQAGRVRVRARQQGRGEREQQAHLCHHLRTFFFFLWGCTREGAVVVEKLTFVRTATWLSVVKLKLHAYFYSHHDRPPWASRRAFANDLSEGVDHFKSLIDTAHASLSSARRKSRQVSQLLQSAVRFASWEDVMVGVVCRARILNHVLQVEYISKMKAFSNDARA